MQYNGTLAARVIWNQTAGSQRAMEYNGILTVRALCNTMEQ
jgi:hypothetical protein